MVLYHQFGCQTKQPPLILKYKLVQLFLKYMVIVTFKKQEYDISLFHTAFIMRAFAYQKHFITTFFKLRNQNL